MMTSQITRTSSGNVVASRNPADGLKGGELARTAGTMCAMSAFQQYAVEEYGPAEDGVSATEHAASFVRAICNITSRAQLDHDSNAAYLFHQRVRKPFLNWRASK